MPDLSDPAPVDGSFSQKLPVTLTDVENNKVTITDTSRILALDLYGTLSRTLIGLGMGDKIVGRTVSSTEKQLHDVPVVTENGHTLNVEAIAALKPTLIIADRSVGPREALDQLRESGIAVVLVDPHRSVDKTPDLIRAVAKAIGNPAAGEALVKRTQDEIDAAKEDIAQWAPKKPMKVAMLYVRGTAGIFFILGSEDGASELIHGVGGDDVAGDKGIKSIAPANAESLVSLNPDAIFVMKDGLASTGGMKGLLKRAGVANTTAGKNQRVIAIPDGISLSFGPQTGEVLTSVAKALYGVK
ncbi:hemin ABC transporter substrate-binding protein [Cutibacterium sp.]|uniref:heme/hemin ABC transporter substrate-binding protein n=1 Tax=Cutibacterium sp. TaxID=1912221 RepID=UPI0026DBEF02|nr:ABC transporter substrate-binding protein [Cutibacterium sp.]MDO4411663.1 ABC transporter substrate-binding protein [Cutibacterium sp.]